MSPNQNYSSASSCSSSSSSSSSSPSSSPTPSVNPDLSKLESLLRSGHAVDISVESPATHAVQRIHYMCTEDDMENEAQAWERYVEEYCFPAAVIEDCYGHIEGFKRLASALFDARQSSVAGVCRALSNIPIGHPLPPTGYHKSKLVAAFAVARRADDMLIFYARRVLRYKLKFPDGPDPTVARIRRSMYLEPHIDDRDEIGDDFDPFAMVEPVPVSDIFAMTPPRQGEPSHFNHSSEQGDSHDEDGDSSEEGEEWESVSGIAEEGMQHEAEIESEFQTPVVEESEEVEQQGTEMETESPAPLVGDEPPGVARLRDERLEDAAATKMTVPFEIWDEEMVPKVRRSKKATKGSEKDDGAHSPSLAPGVNNRPSKKMSKSGTAMGSPHFRESEAGAMTTPLPRPVVVVEIPARKRVRSPEPMSARKRRPSRTKKAATPLPDTASNSEPATNPETTAKPDTGLELSEVAFPIACPQPKCSVTINDMNDARSHWIVHPLGQYRCPRCKNRAIKTADALRRHVTIVHRLELSTPVVVEQIELGNQRLTQVWRKALGLDLTGYYGVYRWDQ